MNFRVLPLKLPSHVLSVYESVVRFEKHSIIAGGFLSDYYMGKPHKDIDIFIRDSSNKQTIIDYFDKHYKRHKKPFLNASSYPYKLALDIHSYEIEGETYQLIFTPLGIRSVKFFDFRFREFFYFKGTLHASYEAIRDIQNQELTFGVTKAPLVALSRLFRFKHRYGFSVQPEGFERLKALFLEFLIPTSVFESFVEEKVGCKVTKEQLLNFMNQYKSTDNESYIEPRTIHKRNPKIRLMLRDLPRDLFDKLIAKRQTIDLTFYPSDIPAHLLDSFYQRTIDTSLPLIKKERLRLCTASPLYYEKMIHLLKEVSASDPVHKVTKIDDLIRFIQTHLDAEQSTLFLPFFYELRLIYSILSSEPFMSITDDHARLYRRFVNARTLLSSRLLFINFSHYPGVSLTYNVDDAYYIKSFLRDTPPILLFKELIEEWLKGMKSF